MRSSEADEHACSKCDREGYVRMTANCVICRLQGRATGLPASCLESFAGRFRSFERYEQPGSGLLCFFAEIPGRCVQKRLRVNDKILEIADDAFTRGSRLVHVREVGFHGRCGSLSANLLAMYAPGHPMAWVAMHGGNACVALRRFPAGRDISALVCGAPRAGRCECG